MKVIKEFISIKMEFAPQTRFLTKISTLKTTKNFHSQLRM